MKTKSKKIKHLKPTQGAASPKGGNLCAWQASFSQSANIDFVQKQQVNWFENDNSHEISEIQKIEDGVKSPPVITNTNSFEDILGTYKNTQKSISIETRPPNLP